MRPVCLVRRVPKHLSRCQLTNNLSIEPVELNLDLEVESTTVLYTGLVLRIIQVVFIQALLLSLTSKRGRPSEAQKRPRGQRL